MIRINLLPIKKARRRATARREVVAFIIIALLALVTVAYLYLSASAKLEQREAELQSLRAQLEEDKKSIGDTPEQEKRKQELTQQLAVLNDLQKRRSGPVRVLDELQEILSPPRNREAQLAQAQNNWNVDWDPRRLWITELTENNGAFDIKGAAENADDVAEFMRRLETADHFSNIKLQVVEADGSAQRGKGVPRIVKYSLSGTISYAPKEHKDDSAQDPGSQGNQGGK